MILDFINERMLEILLLKLKRDKAKKVKSRSLEGKLSLSFEET